MIGNQILLNRIALIERRLQSLAERVFLERDVNDTRDSGVCASLTIDADDQMEFSQGFHSPERDHAGRAFRWAGLDEYFEFRFFVDRRAGLPFRMLGMFAPGVAPESLRATVDYRPIALRVQQKYGMAEIVGHVPPESLGLGVTLTFVCPTVSMASSGDIRQLSFAFSRLVIGDDPSPRASAG
jgi:hypothetical protein